MEVTTNLSNFSNDDFRIIDANLNRLNEGIRVVEDIFRYALNNAELSSKLKTLRHNARLDSLYTQLLTSRDVDNDVLRPTKKTELERTNRSDIVIANFKRAQEASRVLEELLKLESAISSENFKQTRYELYKLEQQAMQMDEI